MRWVAPVLRAPNLLKAFMKALLKAKGEGGAWGVADFLVSNPLFLKSSHGKVRMFLYISMYRILFSVLTKRGGGF